jgi:ribulose-5-phosphate 4-epimerase/fuculose-1-phosphate aldolase
MLEELRKAVTETAKAMALAGLAHGAEGNVSARDPETGLIAITGSQIPYDVITPDDIVIVKDDTSVVWGKVKRSSETPMHTYLYRNRDDLGAVMHTHSEYAIAASIAHCTIPAITFPIALNIGSAIIAVEWTDPGTEDMGSKPHAAMLAANARAALLANHGALVLAHDLPGALESAKAVEEGAKMYMLARAFGEPVPIAKDQVEFFYNMWQSVKAGVK